METSFGLLKDFTSDAHMQVHPHTHESLVGLNEVSFPLESHGRVTSDEVTRTGNIEAQNSLTHNEMLPNHSDILKP